ncbi:MAG TPA: CRISPR-associated protein Cas5 [Solibacterales bacterium]|nr:CRISPR-associated protein Cas5 [Bryobacterales bacterium]
MPSKAYTASFEIAGPLAIFTRPDSGATFVSYPAPTFSALRGMFDCVAWLRTAFLRPTSVEICRPLQFQRYVTNYRGPLRKSDQLSKNASYQLFATVLVDVCYKVYGEAVSRTGFVSTHNHLHYLVEKFERRLRQGRFHHTPCLGWSEFTPTYFGPLRSETAPDRTLNLEIPSMLHSVFDPDASGLPKPRFHQNLQVRQGELRFVE